MVVCICSRLGECLAVPCVLVAGGDIVGCIAVITDCKMESVCAGATLLVGVIECVNVGGGVSVVVPSVGIAGILKETLVCTVIDGKV